jgi:hypothetical protein
MLASCGGTTVQPLRSSGSADDDDNSQTPLLALATFDGFSHLNTTLRFSEGQTVTFKINDIATGVTTMSLMQISGPPVNFGKIEVSGETSDDGDLNVGSGTNDRRFTLQDVEGPRVVTFESFGEPTAEFVVPSVTERTTINFQFRAASGTASISQTIPIIIEDDAGALTLSGQVSKGLVSNTRVRLFSVDNFLDDVLGERQIVEPVQIDETGTYVFTLLPSIDFENLLLYKVKGDGADMICDAPQGCLQTPFGETFEVEDDLDLRAYIDVPDLGTTNVANINILTTLAAKSAQDFAGIFSRVGPRAVEDGQEEVANVFGLPEQAFTAVPFVDITKPITSTDENAIRVAMIGGGVLGAAFAQSDPDDPEDYLDELDDFIDDFGKGRLACQDGPDQDTISIEDVMRYTLDVARINGSQNTQNFFLSRLSAIENGATDCNFTSRPE